jgi:uncharacterized protein (TIGR04255 family)
MPFPDAARVIYNKNPLAQVICQVRFPAILKIDSEIPAVFQERIRQEYPIFNQTIPITLQVPENLKGQIPPDAFGKLIDTSGMKNQEFSTEDNQWKVNLTRSSLALSATNYRRWEQFRTRLETPVRALLETYSPAYYTRIGLRYVNIIRRSLMDLAGVSWSELIEPHMLGPLSSPTVADRIKSSQSINEILLADDVSTVRIMTALVPAEPGGELCYVIDGDFFNEEKTGLQAAFEKLDFLNLRASRLIRWSITDRLHQAMEPQPYG